MAIKCWPLCIDTVNNQLIVYEVHSGTRGAKYFYLYAKANNGNYQLYPLNQFFKGKVIFESHRGRRKLLEYIIDLDDVCQRKEFDLGNKVYLYEFDYTNSGHGPYTTEHIIDCNNKSIQSHRIDLSQVPNFAIQRRVFPWMIRYLNYVPAMINEIKSISTKLGFKILFSTQASRLQDAYEDPQRALKAALTIPWWQGRVLALKNIIRSVHELYVATLIADALQARTLWGWDVTCASDYATAILESKSSRRITLWFQFSLYEWEQIVMTKDTYRLYVRPDIVLFEGEFKIREDLKNKVPDKVVLIDAKINLTNRDLMQLQGYVKNFNNKFGNKVVYIVALLETANTANIALLHRLGYIVITDVNPYGKGKEYFKQVIEKIFS